MVGTFHITLTKEVSTLSLSLAVIVDSPLFGFCTTSSIGYEIKKKQKHVRKTKVKPTGMKKERPIENHEATA